MNTVILTSDMTRKQIEDLTGLEVAYKEKRKTGISIKFYSSSYLKYEDALLMKEKFKKMFPGTKIRMTYNVNYVSGYSVRVTIPYKD